MLAQLNSVSTRRKHQVYVHNYKVISSCSVIVRVSVVLNRTVGDSD